MAQETSLGREQRKNSVLLWQEDMLRQCSLFSHFPPKEVKLRIKKGDTLSQTTIKDINSKGLLIWNKGKLGVI